MQRALSVLGNRCRTGVCIFFFAYLDANIFLSSPVADSALHGCSIAHQHRSAPQRTSAYTSVRATSTSSPLGLPSARGSTRRRVRPVVSHFCQPRPGPRPRAGVSQERRSGPLSVPLTSHHGRARQITGQDHHVPIMSQSSTDTHGEAPQPT